MGKTYGKLSHKLLIDPCLPHSEKLIVDRQNEIAEDKPSLNELTLNKLHEEEVDAVFKYPFIPGYEGHIPNINSKVGDRFIVSATAAVSEHEQYMQLLSCEKRKLNHRSLLESGRGIFNRKTGERMVS